MNGARGVTLESLKQELDSLVKIPGVSNAWVMPIKTRIDMLATGIKTPVGIKIAGPELSQIQDIGVQLETLLSRNAGKRIGLCRAGCRRSLYRYPY